MNTSQLDPRSIALRRLIANTLLKAGRGHLGPAFSLVEILRVLYDDILHHRPNDPAWPERDRLILSKGHGCLALYALLADLAYFPMDWLDRFCEFGAPLGGHPEKGGVPGIEASTGALGHGLPIGVGMALAARVAGRPSRIAVIMGDGETNEGSIWESAMIAAKHGLGNLLAIVDANGMQAAGRTSTILDMEPQGEKWQSFGFHVQDVPGHDLTALKIAFENAFAQNNQPSVVICRTVKGRGFPLAENNADWHHKNKITEIEETALLAALRDEQTGGATHA